ncbi:MAG: transposase, partial [Candidatus Omnitrophica bacterium]|nr:transposase [Candidatus Omnitrophota bacterium]
MNLFPEIPTCRFEPERSKCLCNGKLKALKTHYRLAATFAIGEFHVCETIKHCEVCGLVCRSEELKDLVPHSSKFGFDVLVHVGKAMFLRCRNEEEVQAEIKRKNLRTISLSEIRYLARKFIIYLALAHKESSGRLKELIQHRGGYILHVDSMCDGNSPHLMSGLDDLSKIVLGNVKLPTEKADKIIPFFEKLKTAFGNPLAIVNDMSSAILNAVKQVFKNIPNFICHYHFLRD